MIVSLNDLAVLHSDTTVQSGRPHSWEPIMSLITLDPTNGPIGSDAAAFTIAPRPSTLAGHTLGIIANGLGRSEVMFDALADQLSKWDDLAGSVKVVKPSVAVPPWPAQWAEITDRATVAVTGFGGCGSCSTRSMRDALDLEAAGIPAVCLVHTALVPAVRALCTLMGAADYPFVIVDYPYDPTGNWNVDECNALASQVLDGVRLRLTASGADL
jgi:hypothetical protein